jgi:hypothetical protein
MPAACSIAASGDRTAWLRGRRDEREIRETMKRSFVGDWVTLACRDDSPGTPDEAEKSVNGSAISL